jgi:hypothetical protein
MTRNKTVIDTHNLTLDDNEGPQANPYNAKKPWHTPMKRMKSADDSLFFEEEGQAPQVDKEPGETDHDYKKRWTDLKKKYDTSVVDWKDKLETLQAEVEELKQKATPVVESAKAPPKTREEIDALKTANPELYAQVTAVANEVTETSTAEIRKQYAELEKEKLVLAKQKAKELILKAHPDFADIVADDAFHAWAATKSQKIQDDIYKNPTDGQAAVDALDLYKAQAGKSKQEESKPVQKNVTEDAASLVSTRNTVGATDNNKKIWTEKEIARLSIHDFDKCEAEIELAYREGRVRK